MHFILKLSLNDNYQTILEHSFHTLLVDCLDEL